MLQKRIANYVLDIKKPLGKGANGEVYLGIDLITQKSVAVKQISLAKKGERNLQLIQNEIKIMKQIKNPNVVHLVDVQQSPNNMYLIMEFCGDGTLDEYIKKKCQSAGQQENKKTNYLAEQEAKIFFKQIVNGFKELYGNKIVHRDLKLQNILIHDGEAKIGDFGFSKILEFSMDEPLLRTYAGSPLYMSIQILKEQNYSSKCDIWSLGIIYYEILYGLPPWLAVSIPELINKIENVQISFPKTPIVSDQSRNLILQMLVKDESKRISWEELFKHEFIKEDETNLFKQLQSGNIQNDPFQKEVQRQNLYFRSRILQNIKHAEKEQQVMKQLVDNIETQEQPKIQKQFSQQSQSRNKIFSERNQSPTNAIKSQNTSLNTQFKNTNQTQVQDLQAGQIFQKNLREQEEKQQIQSVSEWLIYRRNKSVFYNYISNKWYELYDQGKLTKFVSLSLYYSLMFALNFCQSLKLQKMNQQLLSQKLDKFNKFSQQAWIIFLTSKDYQTAISQIKNDNQMIFRFLDQIKPSLIEALKSDKDSNKNILQILNNVKIDKKMFTQILNEIITKILSSTIASIKQQDHIKNYLAANKEQLILAIHLNNALKKKTVFKYSQIHSFDFFKYYEDIDNETPLKLAQYLSII